uniref:Baculoviral IAP repeat-containing protein 3-like n=1 Tax=Crassostrea virginica TaxID=6565 RepID=A0A8B8AC81_CRAVI|nr:baculoviral IAP repeat-containing protein 3-like [Crassostrea virginica]XP_022288097.1 baculoviral IAP repeat-containing protein 3-like [Crassostrea virginica]XP_022288098.1 baculoviral IAP repeat-containing protein 3-like [Crassostrea virginica]
MAKPIRRCTSVDETVRTSTSSVKWKLKPFIIQSPKERPTMQVQSEVRTKLSKMREIPRRRQSTGDLQESSNSTSEDLRRFLQELKDKGSSIYVPLRKIMQTKEMYEDERLKRHIVSIDEKLAKLSEDVKGIKRTLRHQTSSSKSSRFSSKLGKKTMAWRERSKRGRKQRKSRSERGDENKQNEGENTDLCLRLLLMMMMNIKGDPLKYIKMEERTRTKSELMSLARDRKDSLFGDAFDGTVAKTRMQDEHRKTLLESFMYHDYHNGFSAAAKIEDVCPLIASSRNIDEYVAKELYSSLPTRQSEGASGSRSYDSRSSQSLHSMNLELIRLETFKNFPASRTISTIKLAKEGFYYSGHDDQVTCFSCGFEKSGWRVNDDPREIHRQQSPNCPFIQAQNVNVPVGDGSNSQDPENVVQIAQQSASNLNSSENRPQSQGTEEATSDENLPSTSERDYIALPPVRNVETPTVQRDPVSEPENTEETRYEENSTNQQQVQSSAINYSARKTQEKINAFLRNLDPLGINFDRPKYPAYAVLATRVSSYQGWPASLTQQPRDLGTAGFFYVGYGDYTRCFFCGGGLRNWEPGDDPWTEHARWFPKCAFVRQNKGDEFVALVQIKHQELEERESMGAGSCATSAENNGEVPNGMVPFDISALSSFQSVQEMGYSVESIKAAFQELRCTKDPEDITGIDIMDVILSKEDRNNGLDIPPQTPDVSHQTGQENQNRNLNGSQNNSGASASSSQNDVNGTASELLSSANNMEEKKKEQRKEKSAAVSTDEEKLDSLNNALAPMSLEDTRSLLEENRQLRELRMCKICMENEASIAMLPCGHLCCCTDCAPAMRKCPICRQFVKGTVRTWLA